MNTSRTGTAADWAGRGRRWRLIGLGVIMSSLSVLVLLVGIGHQGLGLLVEIAGILTTLLFVPLTAILLDGAVRLGRANARSAMEQN